MRKEEWNKYLQRSKTWAIRIEFDLLHSQAYRTLKYGPAIKTLNWFHEKIRYKKLKHKRGEDRWQRINEGEMSFTYREARFRGLTQNQFSRALKELFYFGFIDIKKHGSGLEGDYSLYVLSQRWKDFGKPEFVIKEFPKTFAFGYREKKQKQRLESNVSQRLELVVRKR